MRPFKFQNKNPSGPAFPDPTSFYKAQNNCNDYFGNYNGSAGGGLAYDNSVFQAFLFNGSNAYLDLPTPSPGSGAFSWSFWIRPVSVPSDWFMSTYVMGHDAPDGGVGYDMRLINQSINSIGLQAWGTWDFPDYPSNQPIHIVANTTNHVVISCAAVGDVCKLYINNQLAGTVLRGAIGSANTMRFGIQQGMGDSPYSGLAGFIRFWQTQGITVDHVNYLYNGGIPF